MWKNTTVTEGRNIVLVSRTAAFTGLKTTENYRRNACFSAAAQSNDRERKYTLRVHTENDSTQTHSYISSTHCRNRMKSIQSEKRNGQREREQERLNRLLWLFGVFYRLCFVENVSVWQNRENDALCMAYIYIVSPSVIACAYVCVRLFNVWRSVCESDVVSLRKPFGTVSFFLSCSQHQLPLCALCLSCHMIVFPIFHRAYTCIPNNSRQDLCLSNKEVDREIIIK